MVEVADAVPALKQAALAHIDAKLAADDERGFVSTAGLVVLYTVDRDDGRFVHHVSVGLRAGYTANAVGGSFAILVLELLGLPLDQVEVGVEPSSVHHVEVVLDKAAHTALRSAPVGRVAAADAESG